MIVQPSDLSHLRASLSKTVLVFTCGSFDLIHPGHIDFLEWCKRQGDMLLVAVNADHFVRQRKGPARHIQQLEDRMRVLDALKAVDFVTPKRLASDSRLASIETARLACPDIIVLGHDWADAEIAQWRERLPAARILVAPPRETGRSTSNLIDTIRRKHDKAAA